VTTKPSDNRTEKFSMQMISEFDARENAAVGVSLYDTEVGAFSGMAGAPAKIGYYCRSIYNPTDVEITVAHKVHGDSTTYNTYIPAGQWFHAWASIQTITVSGTSNTTVMLAYVKRGKVDGTGTL
jgi:hypothetical protein